MQWYVTIVVLLAWIALCAGTGYAPDPAAKSRDLREGESYIQETWKTLKDFCDAYKPCRDKAKGEGPEQQSIKCLMKKSNLVAAERGHSGELSNIADICCYKEQCKEQEGDYENWKWILKARN